MVLIDGLVDYISNAVYLLITALTYHLLKLFRDLSGIISNITNTIVGIFTAFYNLMSLVISYVNNFLAMFPSEWIFILVTGVSIYVLLRLYNLIWGGNEG